jgi:hypothetical protein
VRLAALIQSPEKLQGQQRSESAQNQKGKEARPIMAAFLFGEDDD